MSMTKKDYELVAGSLKMSKQWNKKLASDDFRIVCENLANSFNRDNEKFNRERFLKACGVEEL